MFLFRGVLKKGGRHDSIFFPVAAMAIYDFTISIFLATSSAISFVIFSMPLGHQ